MMKRRKFFSSLFGTAATAAAATQMEQKKKEPELTDDSQIDSISMDLIIRPMEKRIHDLERKSSRTHDGRRYK